MRKRGILSFLILETMLAAGALSAELAFPNADFERGAFQNWPVHDGWHLRGGLNVHGNILRTSDQTHPDLAGYFSACSQDVREWTARFYTGKDMAHYPAQLASQPFRISQPFVAFLMTGTLAGGKSKVGLDVNGDGSPDLPLELSAWQKVRKACPHAAIFALNAQPFLNRDVRFVVQVAGEWVSIDRVTLESKRFALIRAIKVSQKEATADAIIELANPWPEEAGGTLQIHVLDYYGKELVDERLDASVPGEGTRKIPVSFRAVHGPDFRITARLFTSSGTLAAVYRHRWTSERLSNGRNGFRIDEGWEVAVGNDKEAELPPAGAHWKNESPIKPSGTYGYRSREWKKYQKYPQVWYRRSLAWPAPGLEHGRVFLHLAGGGDGLLAVHVNGHEVSTELIRRYNDFAYDLTASLRKGENELLLRFRNPDVFLVGKEHNPVVPFRKYWGIPTGLFGHVYLENRPDIFLDHLFIDPSVEKKQLGLRMVLKNVGPKARTADVAVSVSDKEGRVVLSFPGRGISLPPGSVQTVRLSRKWSHPLLWGLESPNLLRLRVQVRSGDQEDRVNNRFGFREFTIRGREVLLNGHRLTLFDGTMTPAENLPFNKRIYGQNANRAPWLSYTAVREFDELGVLTRVTMGSPGPPKSLEVPDRFWQAYTKGQLATVRYFYNNPSIWMWVVGNELGGAGYLRNPLVKTFRPLYEGLIRKIQTVDPSRSVTSDGDLDFWGVSRMVNAHYPHEYGRSYGLPNLAYFGHKGVELMDWFPHPAYDGKRPIFLGEAFSGGNLGPDWLAPLGGEKVYTPGGLVDTWKEWCILRMRAYRDQRFVGFEPFEPFNAVKDFFPVDVYPKEYGRAFQSRARFRRTIKILNAWHAEKRMALHWDFEGIRKGTARVKLGPGEDAEIGLSFRLPAVEQREDRKFKLWLTEDGRPFPRCGRWEGVYSLFPKERLVGRAAVATENRAILKMLKQLRLPTEPVTSAAELRGHSLLITSGEIFQKDGDAVRDWIRRGGRALILGQKKEVAGLPLHLNQFSNTRAHLISQGHPVLDGLRGTDFSWWGEDHWVSHISYTKPSSGHFQVLCETGDELGLRMTPLVELSVGRGRALCCSFLLAEKYRESPVPARLLANVLRWAAKAPSRRPARAGGLLSDRMTRWLRTEGWQVDDLAQSPSPNLSDFNLLWVDAGLAEAPSGDIKEWVNRGGTLVLSRLDPVAVKKWKGLVPFPFRLKTSPRDVVYGGELHRDPQHAFCQGMSDYDLWWKRGSCPRGGPKMRITCVPVEFLIIPRQRPPGLTEVLRPGALWEAPLGKGRLILDQVRWEEAFEKEQRSRRVFATWVHHAGLPRGAGSIARQELTFRPVPLEANRPLARGALEHLGPGIEKFPKGKVTLAGADFMTRTEGPAFLLLGAPKTLPGLPRSVTIPVRQTGHVIYFWHSCAFGFIDYHHGKTIAEYRVKIKGPDGPVTKVVPIRYGQDVYEYLGDQPGTLDNAAQVTRSAEQGISSYVMKWTLPEPGREVDSIEIAGTHDSVAPLLFGISLGENAPRAHGLTRRREGSWSVAESSMRFTEISDTGRAWAILGPFENRPHPRGGFDKPLPPEARVDLGASFTGKDRMKIQWKRATQPVLKRPSPQSRMVFEDLDLIPFKPNADKEHWTAYAYTKIKSPAARRVIIAFGSDDGAKMWVNGANVFDRWVQRGALLGQELIPVHLKKGWNTVLIKIVNCFGSGGFSFDLKPWSEDTVASWKRDWKTLAPVPPLELLFDAYAEHGKGGAAQKGETGTRSLAGILDLQLHGRRLTLDGLLRNPSAGRVIPGGVELDYGKGKGAAVVVKIPQKGPAFQKGSFELSFLIPPGASTGKMHLASRNAGGSNFGDVFLWLTGGRPSEKYGGRRGETRPCQTIQFHLDRKQKEGGPVSVPIKGGISEGVWHTLGITWGHGPDRPGFRLHLDGREVTSIPDYTGPVFNANVPLSLAGDHRSHGQGAISIRNIHLRDF